MDVQTSQHTSPDTTRVDVAMAQSDRDAILLDSPKLNASVRSAVQAIISQGESFSEVEAFQGLDMKHLELARIWCWQNFGHDDYTVDTILELYRFILESFQDGLPLGPTAFRYCRTLEEVKAQYQRTKEILGDNVEAFVRHEKIDFGKIGDYEIKMHRHDCEYGSGLISLSMWRGERKVFQVSFYPSNPLKIYEIKGYKHSDDETEKRILKRDYHRFRSKHKLAPSSALVVECLKIAQDIGVEVDIAGYASAWRNFDIARNKEKRDQANSVHRKVKEELGLKYNEQVEAIMVTTKALNQIHSENKTEPNSRESWNIYHRSIDLIRSALSQYASLFEGGDSEFITKLLFSRYGEEFIDTRHEAELKGDFRNLGKSAWHSLLGAIKIWCEQHYQIPTINIGHSSERDFKEDWLRFDLPFFMRVDSQQRDGIIKDKPLVS